MSKTKEACQHQPMLPTGNYLQISHKNYPNHKEMFLKVQLFIDNNAQERNYQTLQSAYILAVV